MEVRTAVENAKNMSSNTVSPIRRTRMNRGDTETGVGLRCHRIRISGHPGNFS